jgi:hypothetical protein
MQESKRRNRLVGWSGFKFRVGENATSKKKQQQLHRLNEIEKLRERLEEIGRHRLPLSYHGSEDGFGRLLRSA